MSSVSREAGNCNPENNDIVESGNLSSTLEKLYLWEQKLYKEVKVQASLDQFSNAIQFFVGIYMIDII